jgi:Icc-related predicted phosphoesterase
MRRFFMRVQFVSDLHLNVWGSIPFEKILEPKAKVLVLAGDIGHPDSIQLRSFLKWCSLRWDTIFWIPGHHEMTDVWHLKSRVYDENLAHMRVVCAEYPNIQLLHRDAFVTEDGFVFLGCPLWARLTSMSEELSSDPVAQSITKHYEEDLKWLRSQIRSAELPVVVATHYPPTYTLFDRTLVNKPTGVPFALETEALMRPPVVAWICGYLHDSVEIHKEYMDAEGRPGEVLIVSNALGYPDEPTHAFRKDAVLRLAKP